MDTLTVDAARNFIVIPASRWGTALSENGVNFYLPPRGIHWMNANFWKYCIFLIAFENVGRKLITRHVQESQRVQKGDMSYAFPLVWQYRFYRDFDMRGQTLAEMLPTDGAYLIFLTVIAFVIVLLYHRTKK